MPAQCVLRDGGLEYSPLVDSDSPTVNVRRLYKLLNDGLSDFLVAYFFPWSWWVDEYGDDIFVQSSIDECAEKLVAAVAADTGFKTEEASHYVRLILQALDTSEPFSNIDELIGSIREACELFQSQEMHRADFATRARKAVLAVVNALLTDHGELTATFRAGGKRHWRAEDRIDENAVAGE